MLVADIVCYDRMNRMIVLSIVEVYLEKMRLLQQQLELKKA